MQESFSNIRDVRLLMCHCRMDDLPLDVQSRIYARVLHTILQEKTVWFSKYARMTRALMKQWMVLFCSFMHVPYEDPIGRMSAIALTGTRYIWTRARCTLGGHYLEVVHTWARLPDSSAFSEAAATSEVSSLTFLDLAIPFRKMHSRFVPFYRNRKQYFFHPCAEKECRPFHIS